MSRIEDFLDLAPVVPVVTVHDLADAVPLARALTAGGLLTIEVTLRTPCALDAIAAIASESPNIVVGAGTVANPADLDAAAKAGARFAISPGSTAALREAGKTSAIPYLPAIATASELMEGLAAGYTAFKLFPAEAAGGVALLRSLGGPFPQVRFCPTGGISLETAPGYLALPNVACVGGSWMIPDKLVKAKNWAAIEAGARATVEALRPDR
jgi:2-dehydro-3-deoxyphosphogluconate aldolase/(4S)-4-hydroxy-2-oxoglutarate aldolase